jgi:hypothetical protein
MHHNKKAGALQKSHYGAVVEPLTPAGQCSFAAMQRAQADLLSFPVVYSRARAVREPAYNEIPERRG